MVNVTIYSIHGSYMGYGKYGNEKSIIKKNNIFCRVPAEINTMDFARLACSGTALCCATNGPMASIWFNTHRIHVCYIYGNIYHQYTPNVGINTIHGSYGIWFNMVQGLPRLN